MADAAKALFDSISTYRSVLNMIDRGEAEDQYLECKAPGGPQLGRDLKTKLAEATSGFANTSGGVILWGVATDTQPASGLDLLTQISPIGNVQRMLQRINVEIPRVAVPQVSLSESKVLKRRTQDTKGIIATYIPSTDGDPVQSTMDREFYLRISDGFFPMPYETLQRMFIGAKAPVLRPYFHSDLCTADDDGLWTIRVSIANDSNAVARDVCVSVEVLNRAACETVRSKGSLQDISGMNPERALFSQWMSRPIHRGLGRVADPLVVRMMGTRRRLDLKVSIYADGMRAREWTFNAQLATGSFSVRNVADQLIE